MSSRIVQYFKDKTKQIKEYPKTITRAIFSDNGERLDETLNTLNNKINETVRSIPTESQKASWDAKSNFSGNYNDLTNKPTIPTKAEQIIYKATTGETTTDTSVQKILDDFNDTFVEIAMPFIQSKGEPNGLAELGENGLILPSQLPSYVDDVLEYANLEAFPTTGESGKIYIALDTNKTYRWGGSGYVVISETLAIGETAETAYRGDRGKIAYDHSQTTNVHITDTERAAWNAKQDAASAINTSNIGSQHVNSASSVFAPNGSMLWTDGEGGNLRLISPNGNHVEMDMYNNDTIRLYAGTPETEVTGMISWDKTTSLNLADCITTGNIGNQSVNYANSAGSAGTANTANGLGGMPFYNRAGVAKSYYIGGNGGSSDLEMIPSSSMSVGSAGTAQELYDGSYVFSPTSIYNSFAAKVDKNTSEQIRGYYNRAADNYTFDNANFVAVSASGNASIGFHNAGRYGRSISLMDDGTFKTHGSDGGNATLLEGGKNVYVSGDTLYINY